ncbi:hypothetical protein HYX11_00340 [Candidatus Woesearchaeota archaeon]|nr:hypothetical protein [Candidatus Woesearchaeota archaeon]
MEKIKSKQNLEEAIKEKVLPLLEETMEKSWGVTIPKIEQDISDKLSRPGLNFYVASGTSLDKAKKKFKQEFLKRELQQHEGNVSQLAKMLGVDRRSIHRAVKAFDIDVKVYRAGLDIENYQEKVVDQTIRNTLEQYKEILQPSKLENMYKELPELSKNIAKVLPPEIMTWKEAEREFEKQLFLQVLDENEGKVGETARKLKIRIETLQRKMKKLGIGRR